MSSFLKGPTKLQTIVIAWVDVTSVWDGRPFKSDLGEGPKLLEAKVAHACIWLNEGAESDIQKAAEYCQRENRSLLDKREFRRVFMYPTTEPCPLARARRDVLT